ncbi:MAG: putative cupin superfamily protein [Halioglobus sp.]|jgi:uncharacterized cupin superfamily protein
MKPTQANTVPSQSGSNYPEPYKSRMGDASWRPLGEQFGLTQFGVNLETLAPNAESALRHWHDLEDEFVYVLEGELVLRTNEGESTLTTGMCIGFKAGVENAHHLVNRSDTIAHFMVIGSRDEADTAYYPDDDLVWVKTEDGHCAAHKDGEIYEPDT